MERRSFNQNWMFYKNGGSALTSLFDTEGSAPIPVTLPYDASIRLPRKKEDISLNGNGYFQEITCHYTKNFMMEAADKGKKVWLEFEGVYQNAYVYINGAFAGKHLYGYGNFYIDATSYVRFGESNFINVVVKNGVNSGRWYTGGGIYRKVTMFLSNRVHLGVSGAKINAAHIENKFAEIEVNAEICHEEIDLKQVCLYARIFDPDGKEAASSKMRISLPEGTKDCYKMKLYVKNPKCWDVENPLLYRYELTLTDDEHELDSENGTFGIRQIQSDPFYGLRVNGKTVNLKGGCIHHDNGIIGANEFEHAARDRVKKLKSAGYNAIRSSHYPISKELLKACDELGMYVMDEYTDVWTATKVDFDYGMYAIDCWQEDLRNMIDKDYNHPCVIMYSIGNEIMELSNPYDVQWGKKFADYVRKNDPSRLVTNSMNPAMLFSGKIEELLAEARVEQLKVTESDCEENSSAPEDIPMEINTVMNFLGSEKGKLLQNDAVKKGTEEAAGQLDVIGYNYAAERYQPDGEQYPNWVLFGSETLPKDLDVNWELVEKLPYVIGDFVWTAWDYLGEPGIGHTEYKNHSRRVLYKEYPYKSAYCGDIDLIGVRRPASYWRETIWSKQDTPFLFVQPPVHHGEPRDTTDWGFTDAVKSWTFHGQEGNPVTVEVYTGAEEAELYVDENLVERKKVGEKKKNIVYFETIYQPGALRVITYNHGVETGRDELRTANENTTQLQISADRAEIPCDGSDIAYIDIWLADSEGILNMDHEKVVTISIDGPGVVEGFGSGNPKSEENYFDTSACTYEGRLRSAIRGNGEAGMIKVIFEADGCESQEVWIESRK